MLNNKWNICNIRNRNLLAIHSQCSAALQLPHTSSIVFSCMLNITFCYCFCLQSLRVLISILQFYLGSFPIFSRRLRNFSSNKNIAMWINHAFYLIRLISATRIMRGPTSTPTTGEEIVVACTVDVRTVGVHRDGLWHNTSTLLWNLFDQFTAEGPRFLHHEASRTFLASDPVVDVTLDKEFFSNGAPQSKVHGFIMRLAQWNCGGHSCVCIAGCPCRPWSDSVCTRREAWISCEGITPDQSPTSSVRLLVAIGLESVAMGTSIRVNSVNAWRGRRHFCFEIFAIERWRIFWQTCVNNKNEHSNWIEFSSVRTAQALSFSYYLKKKWLKKARKHLKWHCRLPFLFERFSSSRLG